jgi:cytochrome c553
MPQSPRLAWLALTALAGALTLGALSAPGLAQSPPNTPPASTAASAQATTAEAAAATQPAAPAETTPDTPFTHGKAADGATKAAVCSACHGPNGNSVNPEWPKLAGQSAVYIAEQLKLFRAGVRANPVMQPLAAGLSDQDISDLAVYFEAQTPAGLEADPSYWQTGEALYLRGDKAHEVPACVACHGPVGRGNLAAGYPALRAQQAVYVVKQLGDYASGARYKSQRPETASRNGVMMFTVAKRLSAEQMRDVASYVQGMR